MEKRSWTLGRVGALAIIIGFWSNSVMADPIPEEILGAEEDECLLDCEDVNEEEMCAVLCGCAIKRIDRKFDYDSYLEFKQEMASGLISDENQNFSAETGLVCTAEAQQAMSARRGKTDRQQQ